MSALLQQLVNQPYKHGFVSNIESDIAPKGLSTDTIRMISAKKNEPTWLLDFRLQAYQAWLKMTEPTWPNVHYPKIDFQAISYYAAPKHKPKLNSMDEVDPELLRTFEKLGVPLHERMALAGVAVDVIFDSVSVATTYKAKLAEVDFRGSAGIPGISEKVLRHCGTHR
jgi:Fe-S cluster assembly protein SufB